jgi:protein-L-isoaspartate(D-aspartate) O-methyltransferase
MLRTPTILTTCLVPVLLAAALPAPAALFGGAPPPEKARAAMVEGQIAERGIRDAAMRAVPRHRFVPEGYRDEAYADHPVPIGFGQTISQPYIVAFMTEAARVPKDGRVLEIGTGSGYQAAVLAQLGAQVYTVEIVPELARRARETLAAIGYGSVAVRAGDGYFGWSENAPYDAIVVTCAASHIPPALIDQLKPGGRLVIPLGSTLYYQSLTRITKIDGQASEVEQLLDVRFVPMTGRSQEGR